LMTNQGQLDWCK